MVTTAIVIPLLEVVGLRTRRADARQPYGDDQWGKNSSYQDSGSVHSVIIATCFCCVESKVRSSANDHRSLITLLATHQY
jgi:hypothetical protein